MSILPILKSVLLIVEVLSAFLLVVVILAQKSKDQGLGMAFGSGMGESLFGSRAGNVLTRMTITLAAVFMLATIALGILFAQGRAGGGSVMDRADRQMPVAPAAVPPASAPLMPEAAPAALPDAMPSAPAALQMDAGGELQPMEAASPAPEAPAAPVPEGESAPQD